MQDVVHLFIIADQLQQGLMCGSRLADTEKIFCSRIEPFDQQVFVNDDDTGVELFCNSRWWRRISAVGITFAGFVRGRV